MKHLKKFEELNQEAIIQLNDFNTNEDRVKSSFMDKKLKTSWKIRLERKYPLLSFTFYNNSDTLKAQATIKN